MTSKKPLQTSLDDNPNDDIADHNVFELEDFLRDRQNLMIQELEDDLEWDDDTDDWWDNDYPDDDYFGA